MASLIYVVSETWATHPGAIIAPIAVCIILAVMEYAENIRPKRRAK